MNNLYRSLISLATVFPLSITFSYLYSDWLLSLLPDVVSLDVILTFATPSTFHGVAKHAIFAGVQS